MKIFNTCFAIVSTICFDIALTSTIECKVEIPDGPVRVTADCLDPVYHDPVIVNQNDDIRSVPHRKFYGYFKNTSIDFNLYLPPKPRWRGRFYQRLYPTQDVEASDEDIAFAVEYGAYTVQTRGTSGYQAAAAAAKFARSIASRYYNHSDNIYGYIYGGSGGSYQTVGAMENTEGVWDGAVTIVQAVPASIPNVPAVRAFAGLVLLNKSSDIIDAVRPGGTGDPSSSLSDAQVAMFREATLMGIPVRKWEDFDKVADTRTLDVLAPTVYSLDPDYCQDFWSVLGYLGSEDSALGDILRSAIVDVNTTITSVERSDDGSPEYLHFKEFPASDDSQGFLVSVYARNGTLLPNQLAGSLNQTLKAFVLNEGNDASTLDALDENIKVRIDNRCFIALLPYYRYRLPSHPGFYGFDQFRGSNGQPLCPQRDVEVAALVSEATSGGGLHTGRFGGKMIVVDNLWDTDAFPCHADWYRNVVQNVTGHEFNDKYRIWYNDHADHNEEAPEGVRASYLVNYNGIYQQALHHLSQWAEQAIAPPLSTRYNVSNSQILVPSSAAERRGIQATVQLRAQGKDSSYSTTVDKGQRVNFAAHIEAAPGSGKIVTVEWDYLGIGNYKPMDFGTPTESLKARTFYAYQKKGTYFAGIR
ncbi:hypothetical protein FSARC_7221, partial [Fusarium sarcochroum]